MHSLDLPVEINILNKRIHNEFPQSWKKILTGLTPMGAFIYMRDHNTKYILNIRVYWGPYMARNASFLVLQVENAHCRWQFEKLNERTRDA